ncbi:hypothetical protein Q9Z25_001774 [Staphylococcus pseudintermedius]|uniref:XRE family transcriptional regulator n=3 Tax=Staphylococcus pseudintermedius TaxID=283734 RepID=A0A346TPA8_STAPS|nr:hypothetical protein [Staphylococcus pseudintermedius]AXU41398.1 hypothetical protein [Staphylococcus pseudintermedius]EGQ0301273.1 hypothetical protein [Staphylococcus pseudintermedius]EGQ0327249.1 hypothetical protein [Staphylococcus pseudintermedius]EGQ1299540.1 hypothetical protein [Staphylococcus pseudintermedius]EGQ1310598.1 hypothetical protein [Staphylococcus pseudintermedius]
MDKISEITKTIEILLANNTPYSISKNSGIPRQTVTDLKNGKSKIEDARFRTIKALYEYQKHLEKENK